MAMLHSTIDVRGPLFSLKNVAAAAAAAAAAASASAPHDC
jgi:hypothetical protein